MNVTKGIYQKGSVTLLTTVSWQDGTAVEIIVPETEEFSADGSPWPSTDQEREAWARELENMPALFDSAEDAAAFETSLSNARREQAELSQTEARTDRIAKTFD